MDGFNEKSNEEVEQQQPLGCLHRFSKTIKIVIIGGLIILLMIPMFMIEDLISERGKRKMEPCTDRHRTVSEYPVSGRYGKQRGKESIYQRPDVIP